MKNLDREPNGYHKTKSPKRPVEWTEDYAFCITLHKKCVSEKLLSKNQIEKNEKVSLSSEKIEAIIEGTEISNEELNSRIIERQISLSENASINVLRKCTHLSQVQNKTKEGKISR